MRDEDDFDDTIGVGPFRINLWLLSSFRSKFTGVDTVIEVSMRQKGLQPVVILCFKEKTKEMPNRVIMTIDKPHRILWQEGVEISDALWSQLTKWIELNRRALMRHWAGLTDTMELIKELKKI